MDKVDSFIADKTGVRLDKYVVEECSELSRTYAQKLIADGNITVNDRVAKASFKLSIGDRVDVVVPPPTPQLLVP